MANFQLSYSGSDINGWGQRIATLETQMANQMNLMQYFDVSSSNVISPLTNLQGGYIKFSRIVIIQIRITLGETGTTANTATTLTAANTFPIPYANPNMNGINSYGYLSSGQVSGAFYIDQTGALKINGNSNALAANSTHQIAGAYITAE